VAAVEVTVRGIRPLVSKKWIAKTVATVLRSEFKGRVIVGVLLTGDPQIRGLNRKFLKHDRATDVISFGLGAETPNPEGQSGYLGDLVVSQDTAVRLSKRLAIPAREELARYLVHGVLHLAGYEDSTPARRKTMEKRQETLIRRMFKKAA